MTSPGKEGAGQHVYALEPPRYLDHCIEMPSSSTPRDSAASRLKTRPIQLFVQYKPGNSGNHKDDINLCSSRTRTWSACGSPVRKKVCERKGSTSSCVRGILFGQTSPSFIPLNKQNRLNGEAILDSLCTDVIICSVY
jgi:hypothetical protein